MHRSANIEAVSAITGLGESWQATWHALLHAERRITSTREIPGYELVDVQVCGIRTLDRLVDQEGRGSAFRLLQRVLARLAPYSDAGTDLRLYGGSNHGESDLLVRFLTSPTKQQAISLIRDSLPEVASPPLRWTYAACSSGAHALSSALLDYADGFTGNAVVAAVDTLSVSEIVGFKRVAAVTRGEGVPFSASRDGLLIGEGAAAIWLAPARPHSKAVWIAGFGLSCDAQHPTDPDSSGRWLEAAILRSLATAGLPLAKVGGIVAHGTGTEKNDAVEADVFRRLWPAADVPVTSIKGTMGHTMGAAGLFNVMVAMEAARTGLLPPISAANLTMLPGVDFVVGKPRPIPRDKILLAISSGFGGNNAVVLVHGPVE
jgi:3-oxoacyl-[acyl-carrier-protein] synthase II